MKAPAERVRHTIIVAHRTARIAGLKAASRSDSPSNANVRVPTDRSVLEAEGDVLGMAVAVIGKV